MSYTIPTMTVPELLAALRAAPAQDVMIIMNDHQQEIIAALSGLESVRGALKITDETVERCAKAMWNATRRIK